MNTDIEQPKESSHSLSDIAPGETKDFFSNRCQDISFALGRWSLEKFFQLCPCGPFLALDWGKSRCGLALSDSEGCCVVPLEVVSSGGPLRGRLVELWTRYKPTGLVVGWPCHDNGFPGPLCHSLVSLLGRLTQDHGWCIGLCPEVLTSVGAHECQEDAPWETQGRKAHFLKTKRSIPKKTFYGKIKNPFLDHHAAALILKNALHQRISLLKKDEQGF